MEGSLPAGCVAEREAGRGGAREEVEKGEIVAKQNIVYHKVL